MKMDITLILDEYFHEIVIWGCKEGKCKACNAKKDIVITLAKETGSYVDWLSDDIIDELY